MNRKTPDFSAHSEFLVATAAAAIFTPRSSLTARRIQKSSGDSCESLKSLLPTGLVANSHRWRAEKTTAARSQNSRLSGAFGVFDRNRTAKVIPIVRYRTLKGKEGSILSMRAFAASSSSWCSSRRRTSPLDISAERIRCDGGFWECSALGEHWFKHFSGAGFSRGGA